MSVFMYDKVMKERENRENMDRHALHMWMEKKVDNVDTDLK